MARPVDDILADLLALEEEAFGAPQSADVTQDLGHDGILAETNPAGVQNAEDDALLADCDALLADVDLLLADHPGQPAGVAAASSSHGRQPQPSSHAARSATAAVLSECDALLADADLLLADSAEDVNNGAAAVRETTRQSAGVTAAPTAQIQQAAAPLLTAADVPVPPAAGDHVSVTEADSVAVQAAAAPAPPSDSAADTTAPSQPADIDLLLMDLLSPADNSAAASAGAAAPLASGGTASAGGMGLGAAADIAAAEGAPTAAQGSTGDMLSAASTPSFTQAAAEERDPVRLAFAPGEVQQQLLLQQHEEALQQQGAQLQPDHQQQVQHQVQASISPSQDISGGDSGSSSEDFLGDMLHDMAEVLEVDESALAADQQLSAPTQPVAAAPPPAASEWLGAAGSSGAGSSGSVSQWQPQAASAIHADPQAISHISSSMVSWQPVPVGDAGSAEVRPHEVTLQQAWAREEALVHGGISDAPLTPPAAGSEQQQQDQQQQGRKRRRLAPLPRLQELLSDAMSDWNPAGRPDASGTAMIGGSVLLCLESLAGLFAAGAAAAGGAAAGVDWRQVLSAAMAPHGQLQAVAASGQYLAVGTSSGSTLVFQLPVPQGSAGHSGQGLAGGGQNPAHIPHSMGSGHSSLPGGAAMWQLGGHSGSERGGLGVDPVSSLGFSIVGGGGEALWLAVGHVSGALTVWELQKRGPKQIAGIAQHSSRLTFTTFIPGRATGLLLSGDVRGRCCLHTFSASLLRTNVASRVLINGEYGPLLSIAHLAPFGLQLSAIPPGAVTGSTGIGGAAAAGSAPWPDAAAWRVLCEDGAWRVGEGVCCLTTPTHAYIARIKPSSGDLVMLFSIPQPQPGAQQQAVPVAAWMPHNRQKTGSRCQLSDDMLMPVGILGLAWGSRLVLFEVPLIGDQITAGEAAAVAAAASSAAAAAQQAKRGQGAAAVAAAAASRLWQQRTHTSLDGLTPEAAVAVASQFPLSTTASWVGGQQQTAGQEAAAAAAAHDLQQRQLQMGPSEPLPILGVHWLDSDALAVVCHQGFSSLLLVLGLSTSSTSSRLPRQSGFSPPASLRVYEQVEWMDHPVDRGWGSVGVGAGGLTSWGADCGGSVVGCGARMYLLGQQGGVFCGRLMPWSERLKTLQDVRKYKLGLYFALRFYLAMQQQQQEQPLQDATAPPAAAQSGRSNAASSRVSGSSGLTPRQSLGGFARSEGLGAEPQQLEQWLLSLVLGHATATLQDAATAAATGGPAQLAAASGAAGGAAVAPAAVVVAAEACVCTCLLLSRTDVLFGRVFALFAQKGSGQAAGALGALMETVELAVLSDLVQGLAPEVMQALVDHFAGLGQPGRVEACVVHLSIMSLDLNQVIRLCEGSCLLSALTHIYNQMGDYRKPLLDLLASVAAAASWPAAQAAAYKLLVYLRCCFRGMAFPPGTGSLPSDPPGVRDVTQATLLGSLLFLDRADLLREWQQSGGAAAAVAAAMAADGQQKAGGPPAASCPALMALCDPHPALQLLLAVDVPATITVLAEATAGWDAVETDLRAAAGKPTSELESVLVATQVVVNALVTLLEAGRFDHWQAHKPVLQSKADSSSSSSSSSAVAQSGADVALSYIIQLLAAGRVNVKPAFVIKLLQHLVAQATAAAAAAAGTSGQPGAAAAAAAVAPYEQQFMSIVQVVGVQQHVARDAVQQGPPGDPSAFSASQAKEVLQLAKRCNFLRAAATVHHLQGNYAAALACYLALVDKCTHASKQQQQQQQLVSQESHHARKAVFDYIHTFLTANGAVSGHARTSFLGVVCQQVVQLIQLDPTATAALLLQHMPDQQVPVLLSLKADPQLQFQFLRAAMQQNQLAQRQSGTGSAVAGVAAAAAPVESLLERPEVAILYVRLLARFEPSAVLPFLQSHHNYSVAEAIQVCRAAGVRDAETFLHERLGDLDAALRLYISSAQQANRQLQDAVLEGKVPLMQLPPGYCLPGWQEGSRSSHGDTEQECWGLGRLLAQLDALAQRATQAVAAAAAASSTNGNQQQEGVTGDIQQASDELLSAASHAAAALLHQLDPSHMHSSSTCKPDRAATPAGAALLSPGSRPSAAVPHQLAPPIIDLYKSWMAELSPRLKLKGLGAAVAPLPAVGGAKHGAAASSCGASSTAMAHAGLSGLTLPAVPPELLAAWQALQAAVAFCQRNTRASSSSSGPATASSSSTAAAAAAAGGHQLWYELMDIYVANLRALHEARDTQQHQPGSQVLLQPLPQEQQQQHVGRLLRVVSCQVAAQDLPGVLRGAAAAVASQQMLPGLLRLLLDEVVCCMADHLPLLDIVGHVLQQHGNERFGEFRPTLLGLFGATGYDSAIMAAANRLISGDAFAAVRHAYGLRQLARAMHEHQQQQERAAEDAAASASSSRSAAIAPVAAAGMGSLPAAAVQSAMLLGVLGPGSYDSSSSSRIGSRYSLSQADRDLIQGILGAGGMRLQLQPAGVAANQLAGVAGEFKAAAQAVADTGRVFRGEMDLALELAMLQSLQEHQQHQHRQQHGKAGELWGGAWDAHGQGAAGQQQQPGDVGRLGAAPAARATHSTSSFDIDELLTWSHTNMA